MIKICLTKFNVRVYVIEMVSVKCTHDLEAIRREHSTHRVYFSPALPPPPFQLGATLGVAASATLHSAGVALRLLT